MHDVRAAYGWTDEQIVDQVFLWGQEWLLESWKLIAEDRQRHYRMETLLYPLARSPMSKEGASALKRYSAQVQKVLDDLTPWRMSGAREQLKKSGVKPGEIVVMLDPGEPANDPLFEGHKTLRRK